MKKHYFIITLWILSSLSMISQNPTKYLTTLPPNFTDTLDIGDTLMLAINPNVATGLYSIETSMGIDVFVPAHSHQLFYYDSIPEGLTMKWDASWNRCIIQIRNPCQITKFTIERYASSGSFDYYTFNIRANDAVSIKEHSNSLGFEIHPNPSLNEFYVSLNQNTAKPITLSLYNGIGELVVKETYYRSAEPRKVNIEKLSSGIYFLHISVDGKSAIQKIVKE